MLVFRAKSLDKPRLPACIEGVQEVAQGHSGGYWYVMPGVSSDLFGMPSTQWLRYSDDWEVAGTLEPGQLLRSDAWCQVAPVQDLQGREWPAPIILAQSGALAFAVAYGGQSWEPMPTPEQSGVIEVAESVVDILMQAVETDVPAQALIARAAHLLRASMYVDDKLLQLFPCIDVDFATRVCLVACGKVSE